MEKEYYKVHEISKMFNITSRYTRTKIKKLSSSAKFKNRITKDNNGHWLVHRLALTHFKRVRKAKQPFYALTITFDSNYSKKNVENVMKWVYDSTNMKDLEFHYSIETGAKGGKKHIHSFTNCNKKRKLLTNLKLAFAEVGYKEVPIFDLEGWKNYITKDGNSIITLNKK